MTPDEAVALARKQGHIVIVHRGEVFINSFDWAEAQKWEQKGAILVPHFNADEITNRRKKGKSTTAAWEVHLIGACARIEIEDSDGDLVDVTRDALLAAAREKVPA